jgi:hypothetical protein
VENYDYIYGDLPILRADRQPCPVCGHPTGDCADDTQRAPIRIFGLGMFGSLDDQQTYTVMEDVYEDRRLTGDQYIRYRKYRAGQRIPLDVARKEGLTSL